MLKKYLKLSVLSIVIFSFCFLNFSIALAAGEAKPPIEVIKESQEFFTETIGLESDETDPFVIIGNVIKLVLALLSILFFALIVYGSYLWLTAAGNDEQVKKAQKTLIRAIVGLAIVLMSYAITYFVVGYFEAQAMLF
jgi:amino acid transporter